MVDYRATVGNHRAHAARKPGIPRVSTIGATRTRTRPTWVVAVAAGLAVLAVAVGIGSAGYAIHLSNAIGFGNGAAELKVRAQLAGSSQQSHNLLVAGLSARVPGEPRRTDALILVHTDPVQHRTWRLWIPPDVLSTIPNQGDRAIGDAHLYGGAAGTVSAVKRLTGLPINQYLEFDDAAIAKTVDLVGGVWVDVPSVITSAPIGGSASSATTVSAGWQLLGGAQAVTFADSTPSFSDPDYARLRDQGSIVDAVMSQMAKKPVAAPVLAGALAPFVKTTMSLSEFVGMFMGSPAVGASAPYDAAVIGKRQGTLITPDPKALTLLVSEMQAGSPFALPAATLARSASDAAAVVSAKPATKVSVTVNNGAGLSGAAKQAADLLQTQGFRIMGTGNANQSVYKQTFVIYKTDPGLANLVAQYLPPGVKVVRADGMYAFKSDVLVVIGKDWDLTKAPVVPIHTL